MCASSIRRTCPSFDVELKFAALLSVLGRSESTLATGKDV